jgi:Holliday junction DNA helicase RuvB
VGATTRAGQISSPLRDRFGLLNRLEFYNPEDIKQIILHAAQLLNIQIDDSGADEIAKRSRGTPRIANRLLRRVRDFAQVKGEGIIDQVTANKALASLDIDELGLDTIDRKILTTIIKNFSGGPVGVETLAASVHEEAITLEDVYEPYLLQIGFIERTPRGRMATPAAYNHVGIKVPKNRTSNQAALFDNKS